MQVTMHQNARNTHLSLLLSPSLIAGNMINCTQIVGIPAIAGKLASTYSVLLPSLNGICGTQEKTYSCGMKRNILLGGSGSKMPLALCFHGILAQNNPTNTVVLSHRYGFLLSPFNYAKTYLFTPLNTPLSNDDNLAVLFKWHNLSNTIWLAAVVDVTCWSSTHGCINHCAIINAEHVHAAVL